MSRLPRVTVVVGALLVSACGVDIVDPGAPPPPAPARALAIQSAQADLVFTRADDEDPLWPGVQTTLRVDVSDEAIERVALDVFSAQGLVTLDDVVAEDLDGVRNARFVVTLEALPETPVRAFTEDLPAEDIEDARATLKLVEE